MEPRELASTLRRCRDGDREATEAVVRRTGRIAMPLAVAVLGLGPDAADVAQEVALDVLGGLTGSAIRGDSTPGSGGSQFGAH